MNDTLRRTHRRLHAFITRFSAFLAGIKIPSRAVFIVIGVLSTVWFLVRVLPKPSRALYPCMRAAYPFMSGLFVYVLGLGVTLLAFARSRNGFMNAQYFAAATFLFIALASAIFTLTNDAEPVYADSKSVLAPNTPVGIARGINPGRVVWIHDPKSTNENCTNVFGDGWFMEKNTDGAVVASMVADAVTQVAGRATIREAWDALFRDFNTRHGRSGAGYADGEKIFIRTNQVSASTGTYNAQTFEILNQKRYGMAETSPHVVLALLRQLVNECGVKQQNISLGDPMKHMYKHVYDLLHNEFPNVVYLDADAKVGRTKPVSTALPAVYYSDRGRIMKTGGITGSPTNSDYLPTAITEAAYIIAVPAMKAHARAGVSLCAKLHFGSNLRGSATHLHGGLVSPDKASVRTGYGIYRVQVDLMGHRDLGEKTVLFLLDALWAGSEANDPPRKFMTAPFNNDWTSSIMASQDQVALESVGYDFLKSEFTAANPFGSYPQMEGTDDYILQAADPAYWPAGFTYDPENDSVQIGSLGVCEHWNNAADKLYSRNLKTGNGIELVRLERAVTGVTDGNAGMPESFSVLQNYPNPFNPSTTIRYHLPHAGPVSLSVSDIRGRTVAILVDEYQHSGVHACSWNALDAARRSVPTGVYYATVRSRDFTHTIKLLYIR